MSRNLISRRAGVLAAVTAAGVLTMACPAMADVTVNPPSAPQGSGQNIYFQVTNTGHSAMTRIQLVLPADNPIAEVFPLSVDDWGPRITPMTLTTPLVSAHSGTPVTETAAAITWIAAPGRSLAPGRSTELGVALGPLPGTPSITFTLRPTYADGKAGPALSPVTLTLTPAAPGTAPGHGGHGGPAGDTTGEAAGDPDAATFAAVAAQAENDGPGFWTVAGWVLAGLAITAAAVLLIRGRRVPPPDAAAAPGDVVDEAPKEPVTAGAPRVTSWSYRDGPDQ